MRITTWNVNSIKQRLGHLLAFLGEAKPDVVCLQELKCQDAGFPREEIEAAGYAVETLGQKAYNGVAMLVRQPLRMTQVLRGLPGDPEDEQARYLEALVVGEDALPVRVATIYLPNGNPAPGPKYEYKLAFMERLRRHARRLMETEEALVLAGDYNVIPMPEDASNPEAWTEDALFLPATRRAFRALLAEGFTEAVRACDPRAELYTFWDYQAGCWQRNAGIRIDHVLLSPQAADRLVSASVQKHLRGLEKPSDHVPVTVELTAAA
ncbi:exodeoxyribonuclease III [Methylobacterium haplocladii]|uniref:Exodeoxyribonuclease III n=1 Tax=Methylobacterium haplocladii TaxID=1176176 RepID=A0A512INI6_9HYPH|nr:exodeoxyribonuclease III [Methylobacterium haplocladii]GEO99198.1 exodeoxyribonuclease III [Methylobacterium haplocladii]GJD83158.1 Exodeoxyribonuclease III [Methylobacterium haplocladii]GLS59098.1 exodeoxyribonuclease III [Methylobacterium haplocladii]